MCPEAAKIVVAGDACIDWLQWTVPGAFAGLNWELYPHPQRLAMPGGALLLAEMVRLATGVVPLSPRLPPPEDPAAEEVLKTHIELDLYPTAVGRKDAEKIYRVACYRGFTGPTGTPPAILPVEADAPDASIVVLDDAGNGFRSAPEVWPAALREEGRCPVVVYKVTLPLMTGQLWDLLRTRHAERLVVVVGADALRISGVNISRRLSWERTAKDLVWQMACNPALSSLANSPNLVVRFGLEAVAHYASNPGQTVSRLFFDPNQVEDGYRERYPGTMSGLNSAFVAALVAQVAGAAGAGQLLSDVIGRGITAGMSAARQLLKLGYGTGAPGRGFPAPAVFDPAQERNPEYIAETVIPNPTATEPPDPGYWSILKDHSGARLEDMAFELVREGKTGALKSVPVGQFGKLRTVDRAEIESYRTIRNLMHEYLDCPTITRPLSIAVFGSPGSGKSFGVTQVAESIAGDRKIERLEFNLSQFRSPDNLVEAFHRVRDQALMGAVPLVFFDEFDSDIDGPLGWLKYFLAPMQDGLFRDGEAMHPIGRAIFVFAGGTHSSMQSFAGSGRGIGRGGGDDAAADGAAARKRFVAVKGPDFVSRLRGYVNVMGPNPVNDADSAHLIRRAMLLRSLIERKAPHLLDGRGRARIDEGVLRALLHVPEFMHGARSMEAILDMSMLAGRTSFDQACLPVPEQLTLHVDAEVFSRLVVSDVLLTASRETLAVAIHEQYREDHRDRKPSDDPSLLPWRELPEVLKESNRSQADQIGAKLRRVGCNLLPMSGADAALFEFTPEEIEILAEMEHDRWTAERRVAGWTLGPERNVERRTSPYMVPWSDLADEVREWDREAVRGLPKFLAKAKFEIYRLK